MTSNQPDSTTTREEWAIGLADRLGGEAVVEFDTARIWVTVLGDDEERERSMLGLRSAASFLQSEIARAMRVRRVPRLRFVYDDSLDRALRIEAALREAGVEAEAETEGEAEGGAGTTNGETEG